MCLLVNQQTCEFTTYFKSTILHKHLPSNLNVVILSVRKTNNNLMIKIIIRDLFRGKEILHPFKILNLPHFTSTTKKAIDFLKLISSPILIVLMAFEVFFFDSFGCFCNLLFELQTPFLFCNPSLNKLSSLFILKY